MRRIGVIVALGALLGMFAGVLTASPALAGRGPKWQFAPTGPFTLPAEFCGFKVRVAFPVNKVYFKVLKASDGSMIGLATGAYKASYRNLSTGKAITESVSGPGKATFSPDGSMTVRTTGRTGVFFLPDLAQRLGMPRVGVTAGPLTSTFDPNHNLTSVSLKGHVVVDVCAALS